MAHLVAADHKPVQRCPVGPAAPAMRDGPMPATVQRLAATGGMLNASPAIVAQRALAADLSAGSAVNRTGLPDQLKTGIESLSGIAMDDVRVHRNSSQPAQLNAHAYAQGTDIHLAPGQDQHLPHEAWHVVQQKQGRVQATMQMKGGTPVNDDSRLESEADAMGARAAAGPAGTVQAMRSTTVGGGLAERTASPFETQLRASPPNWRGAPEIVQRAGRLTRAATGAVTGATALGSLGGYFGGLAGGLIGGVAGGLLGALGGLIYDKRNDETAVPWKMYINPRDYKEASRRNFWNPGGMYDRQQSPGFQQSMSGALDQELYGPVSDERIDYAEYLRLHDLVTDKLQDREDSNMSSGTVEHIRTPSSVDEGTAFPMNDWDKSPVKPAQDLLHERLGDMRMTVPLNRETDLENEVALENGQEASVTGHTDTGRLHVRYKKEEGAQYVQQILDRYYNEIGEANEGENVQDGKLNAIVKAVRALHVTHPFKDANGRLHVQLILNRLLREQGFDTTIMPEDKGLGVFGGAFSVPELNTMVRQGFLDAKKLGGKQPVKDKGI